MSKEYVEEAFDGDAAAPDDKPLRPESGLKAGISTTNLDIARKTGSGVIQTQSKMRSPDPETSRQGLGKNHKVINGAVPPLRTPGVKTSIAGVTKNQNMINGTNPVSSRIGTYGGSIHHVYPGSAVNGKLNTDTPATQGRGESIELPGNSKQVTAGSRSGLPVPGGTPVMAGHVGTPSKPVPKQPDAKLIWALDNHSSSLTSATHLAGITSPARSKGACKPKAATSTPPTKFLPQQYSPGDSLSPTSARSPIVNVNTDDIWLSKENEAALAQTTPVRSRGRGGRGRDGRGRGGRNILQNTIPDPNVITESLESLGKSPPVTPRGRGRGRRGRGSAKVLQGSVGDNSIICDDVSGFTQSDDVGGKRGHVAERGKKVGRGRKRQKTDDSR